MAELGEERSAWFSDSEGNIFAIGQMSAESTERMARMRSGSAN